MPGHAADSAVEIEPSREPSSGMSSLSLPMTIVTMRWASWAIHFGNAAYGCNRAKWCPSQECLCDHLALLPSRASILTGFTLTSIGSSITIDWCLKGHIFPQWLQKAGYTTAYIGKWHMGGETDAPPEI